MVKIGRARTARLVLLSCAVLTAGSVALATPVADAGPLEGVTGPVETATETVTAPVTEVTEAAVPPVREVAETAPAPVKEATPPVTAPVHVPAKPVTTPAEVPPAPAASPSPPELPGTGSGDSTGPVGHVAETATHAIEETVHTVSHADRSGSSSPSGDWGVKDGTAAARADAGDVGTPASGRVGGFVPSPSTDGSIRAPLRKWMAYVWPAIALTGPLLAGLVEQWKQGALRAALAMPSGRPGGRIGVAGVRASHLDQPGEPSSPSLFSRIPSALDRTLGGNGPLPLLVRLILTFGVIGIIAAAAWEVGFFEPDRWR